MKKIIGAFIILVMIYLFATAGYNSQTGRTGVNLVCPNAEVKYYTQKGTCPICHEPLVKYCYGTNAGPFFVWSCPKGCEDK